MKVHSLIIGGTRGLGLVLARKLATKGHAVSVTGRTVKKVLLDSDEDINFYALDSDYSKGQIANGLSKIIRKNGLLNNLIFCQRYRGENDHWTGEMGTSLTLTKEVIENLKDDFDRTAETKTIVIVGSTLGSFIGENQSVGYHVAKAGINQLIRYYAVSLGNKGIRVNGVSPFTYLKAESRTYYEKNIALKKLYEQIIPLGRMGRTEEIADLILFLTSQEASYITGQNIVIDGGLTLVWQESLARSIAGL